MLRSWLAITQPWRPGPGYRPAMSEYRVEALSEATWPAFEALVAKHRLVVQGARTMPW